MAATSFEFRNLPVNGAPGYVRLWTKITGPWIYRDYQYTAMNYPYAKLVTPVPGSTPNAGSVKFGWTPINHATYYLGIGTAHGAHDLYWQPATGTSRAVPGLPEGHRPPYVQLYTLVGNKYYSIDYIYTSN